MESCIYIHLDPPFGCQISAPTVGLFFGGLFLDVLGGLNSDPDLEDSGMGPQPQNKAKIPIKARVIGVLGINIPYMNWGPKLKTVYTYNLL